jgi:hypothetical protein
LKDFRLCRIEITASYFFRNYLLSFDIIPHFFGVFHPVLVRGYVNKNS